ncbi:hypothetical protein [Spiroplasma endosymbiont of Tiphia femorata]|uniref:hypothetical protein n=1 Tax=Spiroplasma endosymbiont of Tiphia femorata TaxID=3066326 RepID=UPI0030D61A8E
MLNNDEKFNQNIFEIKNIKDAFDEIDKLYNEVANKFQKYKKNKLLKLEALEINYSSFINFIYSDNKYNLGIFLNNYCSTIIQIPKLILKTKYLEKKKTKIIFSFVKDLLFLVLSILSIILAIVALK